MPAPRAGLDRELPPRRASRRRRGCGSGRCSSSRRAATNARARARRAADPGSSTGSQEGIGWLIHAESVSGATRRTSTATAPAPVSRTTAGRSSAAATSAAAPSTGCPAKGISTAGVKMRARTSPPASGAARKTLSESPSSRASDCIVSASRPCAPVKTASWLPSRGRWAKTSSRMYPNSCASAAPSGRERAPPKGSKPPTLRIASCADARISPPRRRAPRSRPAPSPPSAPRLLPRTLSGTATAISTIPSAPFASRSAKRTSAPSSASRGPPPSCTGTPSTSPQRAAAAAGSSTATVMPVRRPRGPLPVRPVHSGPPHRQVP